MEVVVQPPKENVALYIVFNEIILDYSYYNSTRFLQNSYATFSMALALNLYYKFDFTSYNIFSLSVNC